MRWSYRKKAGTFSAAEDGVVAVEFVILFPLFMLILVGIVEFGHLFYVRHALTNASREGARAAVVYYIPSEASPLPREEWAKNKAVVAVTQYLDKFIPGQYDKSDESPKVAFFLPPDPDGIPGAETGTAATGNQLKVTVSAKSYLLLLDELVPAFKDLTLVSETSMRLE